MYKQNDTNHNKIETYVQSKVLMRDIPAVTKTKAIQTAISEPYIIPLRTK